MILYVRLNKQNYQFVLNRSTSKVFSRNISFWMYSNYRGFNNICITRELTDVLCWLKVTLINRLVTLIYLTDLILQLP